MLSNKLNYEYETYNKLIDVFKKDLLPINHIKYLEYMKKELKFEPKVCYDIGAAVLHWTRHAERIWPNTKVILFDAFEPVEMFYKTHKYNIGLLSDKDNIDIKFYQNDLLFGGNSYYKENNDHVFPDSKYIIKKSKTLDTIVKEKGYLYPDLIKIDVQGAELDVLKGASYTLSHCTYLIVELQDVHYNQGAPLAPVTINYLQNNGWILIASKFSDNGPDGDYCFINFNKMT
jgi:FkbM family methyltransferase